jgi:hypothetical protein
VEAKVKRHLRQGTPHLGGERLDETIQGLASLATLAVWGYVGTKPYKGKRS